MKMRVRITANDDLNYDDMADITIIFMINIQHKYNNLAIFVDYEEELRYFELIHVNFSV